jgi:hypothetical protein
MLGNIWRALRIETQARPEDREPIDERRAIESLARELGADIGLAPHAALLFALQFAQAERERFEAFLHAGRPPPERSGHGRLFPRLALPMGAELFIALMFLLGVLISALLVAMGR